MTAIVVVAGMVPAVLENASPAANPEGADIALCINAALFPATAITLVFIAHRPYDGSSRRPGAGEISNSHTSVGQAVFIPAERTACLQAGTPSGIGLPAFATAEYVKIKPAEDPKAVTRQADGDALAFYWDARDAYEHDLNDKAVHLTQAISGEIRSGWTKRFRPIRSAWTGLPLPIWRLTSRRG